MPHEKPSEHAFLNTVARCLSGQWLIDPAWLFQYADAMAMIDNGADVSHIWPEMSSTKMVAGDGGFVSPAAGSEAAKGKALGVISIVGPIYKYGGWNSSKDFLIYLEMLAKDDQVGAVKIKIDSPGGQNAGTREVYEAILNYPKPTLVVVDGFMASAALYQGAGANKIVATQPTDQIGSMGTYSTYADWNRYYESVGLKLYETYAPKSTEKNEVYRQIMESQGKNVKLLEEELTVLNDQFIADVRAARGDKLSQDVEKGRLYFAPEAIKMGLIDELIQEGETLALLADMQTTSTKQSYQMSLLSRLEQFISSEKKGEEKNDVPTIEQLSQQLTEATAARDDAEGRVTSLTTERDGLRTQVATLTQERDEAQAKADQYGDQPGDKPTKVQKAKDETPKSEGEEKTLQQIIDELPSEKEAAALGY